MSRFWILIFLICMFGCKPDLIKSHHGYFKLVDSLALPALNENSVSSLCVKSFATGSSEYLFWSNRDYNRIEIYNLKDKEHEQTIEIPREGPFGIPNIYAGFTVLCMDTIVVCCSNTPGKLYCIDTSGQYYHIIQYANPRIDTFGHRGNNRVNLNSHYHGDVYWMAEELIIPLRTPSYKYVPSIGEINSNKRLKIYNWSTQTTRDSPIKFDPKVFNVPKVWPYATNSFVHNRIYFQHLNSENLFYTDDLKHLNHKSIKSKYHSEFVPWNDSEPPFETAKRCFYYHSLKADRFRDLLYRIVKLPVRQDDIKLVDGKREFELEFDRVSIMILDKDLNVLGEPLFEQSNYSWKECFVNQKGSHILRSSYHPNYSESKLTFDIYEFRKS